MGEHQFLELRQSLKEQFRKKRHLETPEKLTDSSLDKAYNGSFFGPSQTVFAARLVQDSNFLIQNLKSKILVSNASAVKESEKSDKSNRLVKVERLKESRDYSFLLSDDQQVKPIPPSTEISPPVSLGNDVNGDPQRNEKRPDPLLSNSKRVSVSKSKLRSVALRKQETKQSKIRQQGLPSNSTVANAENNKVPPSAPKQNVEQKKMCLKVRIKLPDISSKPHLKKPIGKENPSHESEKRPFRQMSVSEDEKALSIIRRMFNAERFAGRDDSDMNMEATFEDIVKEEKRCERLARKEDEEELRLIQEEEEKRQRMAKRQKQH